MPFSKALFFQLLYIIRDVIYCSMLVIMVVGLVAGLDPEEEVTDVVCDEADLRDGE